MRHIIAVTALVAFYLSPVLHADTTSAQRAIMENYYKPLPKGSEQLPWNEFKKLVDKHTYMLSPDELKAWNEFYVTTHAGRIGVRTTRSPYGWRITSVVPGSPAYNAGLRIGDVLTSSNDTSLLWTDVKEIPNIIRGPSGTSVKLDFIRNGKCMQQVIIRGDVADEEILCQRFGRTLCVRIQSFTRGIYDRFMKETEHINPMDIDTVIFDLRGDGGGVVDETTKLLSEFIDVGDTLLKYEYQHRTEYETSLTFGNWRQSRTTIILQDSGSASASEMFAGTMAVRCSSYVIGDTSYGKGSMQRLISGPWASEFVDSSIAGVKVSIAKWWAGGTLWIDGVGVRPDVNVDLPLGVHAEVPDTFDVAKWRLDVPVPTLRYIDSANAICGGDVSAVIWGELAEPFQALTAVNSIRHLIPKPFYACTVDHDTLPTAYTRMEEEGIRRTLQQVLHRTMPDSIIRLEPVERALEHAPFVEVVRGAALRLQKAATTAVARDLGMKLRASGAQIHVAEIITGSAAYQAGICVGDRLIAIDGKPLAQDVASVQFLIQAMIEKRHPVNITLRRGVRQFSVACAAEGRGISVPITHMDDGIGFIAQERFAATVNGIDQIWRAMSRMRDSGMHTIVFDLRGSVGGGMEPALRLIEHFAKPGDTLLCSMRNGEVAERRINGSSGNYRGWSVFVLVDSNTADGAEYFAYTMQRNRYATVLGQATRGMMFGFRSIKITDSAELQFRDVYYGPTRTSNVLPNSVFTESAVSQEGMAEIANAVGNVALLRKNIKVPNQDALDNVMEQLPAKLRNADRAAVANVIFGAGARLLAIAPAIKQVVYQQRKITRR